MRDGEQNGAAPLYVVSSRQLDELVQLASGAGWRVTGARRVDAAAFAASGAAVAVVDARGALEDGVAAIRELAGDVERTGAALLALLSRGDVRATGTVLDAGATHFLASPAGEGEFVQAIRFAERFAERLGKREARRFGRRRGDPAPIAQVEDAVRRWATGRLAAGRPVVVARVALASFELVNSAHGRVAGDAILVEAAVRLQNATWALFGDDAIVARASGPEFLVAGDASVARPDVLTARLAHVFADPFGTATVGARVGIAVSEGADDAAGVIRRAGAQLAAPGTSGADLEELAVDIHHAMAGGQIAVLFQPQVAIGADRIVGVEALARWRHPRHGEVGAEALFAAAERAGLAAALSEHVQRLALSTAARWPASLAQLRLSVNVTAQDVAGADFAERFLARVEKAGFPLDRLTVEITETGLIEDLDRAAFLLGRLRSAGCRTAIDDFGTGYSSLAYLNALPLDYLKLDRALVSGVERDGRERVVATGVLALARSLGMATIAEGVETEAQRDLLAREGCDLYQGFLYAGAVDVAGLEGLVAPSSLSPREKGETAKRARGEGDAHRP